MRPFDASANFPNRITNDTWHVGNCAFAFPRRDGAKGKTGVNNGVFARLFITRVGETGMVNKSCAFFFQNPPYNTTFEDLNIHVLNYGYIEAPPTTNVTQTEYAPDANRYTRLSIGAAIPFVAYNGIHDIVQNMQIYAAPVGSIGPMLLSVQSMARNMPAGWTWENLYVEPNSSTTGVLSRFTGTNHVFINGSMKQDASSNNYIQFDADNSQIINTGIAADTTTNPSMKVTGSGNNMRLISDPREAQATVVLNTGRNNHILIQNGGSRIIRRAARWVSARGPPLYQTSADFLLTGNPLTPYTNLSDLLLMPDDVAGSNRTVAQSVTHDASVPVSRAYFHVNAPGAWGTAVFNGDMRLIAGKTVPQTKVRLYIMAKAAQAASQWWFLGVCNPNCADFAGTSFNLTTNWGVYYFDADLSSAAVGSTLQIRTNYASPETSIDVAWLAIRPWTADPLFNNLTLDKLNAGKISPVQLTQATGSAGPFLTALSARTAIIADAATPTKSYQLQLGNFRLQGQSFKNASGTITPDLLNGGLITVTATGNTIFAGASNGTNGDVLYLVACQDSVGGHSVTFSPGWRGVGTVPTSPNGCMGQQFYIESGTLNALGAAATW